MSTLRVSTLQNASSATANVTLDAAGNATVGGTLAMGSSFLRNRIINGDMRIDQRNAGASVTVNSGSQFFPVDRFYAQAQGGGVFTLQQSTTAPTGFNNALIATVTTPDASLTGTDFYSIKQRIEGFNVADLGWGTAAAKTVTLSFWVRSSIAGTYTGSMLNSAENRAYPFSYTIDAANTFEYKTITLAGDTTGTWLTNNGNGVAVGFSLGVGSNFQTSAGSWIGSRAEAATGQTQWISTNGATFYITGVQLEVGSVATPFERRQYGTELMLCQRYFETNYNTSVRPGTAVSLNPDAFQFSHSSGSFGASAMFQTRKRAAPTMVFYDVAGNSNRVSYYTTTWNDNGSISATGYSQASFYIQSNITSAVQTAFMFTAASEL
jgi:hypothetical protein